jgi:hypothetical protein
VAADVVEGSRSVDMFYQFPGRARQTPEEWRDSYGIPGRRRSSNSVIKGQGVVREMARVSEWACLYFFAYVTLHNLPFRDIEDEIASMASTSACPFNVNGYNTANCHLISLSLSFLVSYVAASLVSRLSPCVAAQMHCL